MLVYGRHKVSKKDINSVKKTLTSDYLATGPNIKKYENKISKFLKCKYVSSCSSGTAALHLAFLAAGIKKNDVVILPIINFISAIYGLSPTKSFWSTWERMDGVLELIFWFF